ncbi:MAG: hypothetical protein OXO49_00640 [Gammaproteobacteria bacterium]|nr:hypothetical protein [Gammaproteobacteria bacterium]MDE0251488.1 hypothetical protein [Gammaproteobacteria bacterium]MDE0401829.1 hypothetical protein [Gammaproteobacteria bacterium]
MNVNRDSLTTELIRELKGEAKRLRGQPTEHLTKTPNRFRNNHQYQSGLLVDWSRQFIDERVFKLLDDYATQCQVHHFLHLIAGNEIVNTTEQRAASHIQHRELKHNITNLDNQELQQSRTEMLNLAIAIRDGTQLGCSGKRFTDILHVGIGGSHLGAELVCNSLSSNSTLRIHFVTTVNFEQLKQLLSRLNPDSTLCVVASKSYTTYETIENAQLIRRWFIERTSPNTDFTSHFVHITSNADLPPDREVVLKVPDSVGGRYSVWSSMGFPIALTLGQEQYLDFLHGAHEMDVHVLETENPATNLAIRLALLSLWNISGLDATSHLVLTYDTRLRHLASYLQQLEMESNGKSMTTEQQPVSCPTSPVVWGGSETEGQHAYHQWLHQGTQNYNADIFAILPEASSNDADNLNWVIANALAQSSVMLNGVQTSHNNRFKEIKGQHGSTVFLLKQLDAKTLGSLLALYEHKVACLGYFWGINSFDQWGVETGKQLANDVVQLLQSKDLSGIDPTLSDFVAKIKFLQASSE